MPATRRSNVPGRRDDDESARELPATLLDIGRGDQERTRILTMASMPLRKSTKTVRCWRVFDPDEGSLGMASLRMKFPSLSHAYD